MDPVCRLDSFFFACRFFKMSRCTVLTFMFAFFALLDGRARLGAHFGGPMGGSKTVLGSSGFGPFFVLRLGIAFWTLSGASCRSGSLFWSSWAPLAVVFGRLGLLLGSLLAAPEIVLVLFRHFNSSIQPVNSPTRRFNSSTHQPMALRHFLTRPGGLRAARLNKALGSLDVP